MHPIRKFQRMIASLAWSIHPYEMHAPSVTSDGHPCVVCYTGKVYMWAGWYIVLAEAR